MACPLCGEVCRCIPPVSPRRSLRSRFQPDGDAAPVLVDPEPYDASEEQFAASLGIPAPRPRFVLEGNDQPPAAHGHAGAAQADGASLTASENRVETPPQIQHYAQDAEAIPRTSAPPPESTQTSLLARDALQPAWKDEVAARLDRFRARRKPKPPRYPSLRLKFEDRLPACNPETTQPSREAVAFENAALPAPPEEHALPAPAPEPVYETARIIEFPRPYPGPPDYSDRLAEPVLEKPRILDAPEVDSPPPALGGIILESEQEAPEKRPGFEIPLQTVPTARRVLANVLDGILVLAAAALFAYIFVKFTSAALPLTQVLGWGTAVTAIFWAAYEYLLLVYNGSTPGLRAARLRLSRFDGSPVDRSLRRWRVLASILSTVPLGLGLAWCFLDEDGLCWHDRITGTYLAPLK